MTLLLAPCYYVGMTKDDLDIVGLAEVAKMLGLSYNATAQRRARGQLPPPDVTLSNGPVWRRETIVQWQRQNKPPTTRARVRKEEK